MMENAMPKRKQKEKRNKNQQPGRVMVQAWILPNTMSRVREIAIEYGMNHGAVLDLCVSANNGAVKDILEGMLNRKE
jgi:hypothetical protein